MSIKFYDTCAVLELGNKIFEEPFVICSKTIEELENIKTNARKDESIKYKARNIIRLLTKNEDKYEVVIYNCEIYDLLKYGFNLDVIPDNIIMACAYQYSEKHKDIIFCTRDLACRLAAKNIFSLNVDSIDDNNEEEYKGFKEIVISDDTEMAYFYEHLNENIYNLLVNEYLIIKNIDCEVVDCYRWDGDIHLALYKKGVKSLSFGDKLKPKDIYQSMAIDSLMQNTITIISGKAGSGKSLLSLMAAMHLIENGKYDRLVVMFNPLKTFGAKDMGFYGGDFLEKAMQNFIGQVLITKFGDRYAVDMLIQQEKIKLVSMADARGMEIRDNEILWITEGQNTNIELLKLCLSRASAGCKIFLEGDYTSQVDSRSFDGDNNGMRRAIDVLKGEDIFGHIQLKNVWRSKIADLINKM
ncbi:MAG TPA: hypothetical protein GXZ90_05945 [Clostridiales bacterium]|nr:hypothetical protein [Clostridiales bacterium]